MNVHFLLGVKQSGSFRILLNIEAVTGASSSSSFSSSNPAGDGDPTKQKKGNKPLTPVSRPGQ
jgi:hypothetical protein